MLTMKDFKEFTKENLGGLTSIVKEAADSPPQSYMEKKDTKNGVVFRYVSSKKYDADAKLVWDPVSSPEFVAGAIPGLRYFDIDREGNIEEEHRFLLSSQPYYGELVFHSFTNKTWGMTNHPKKYGLPHNTVYKVSGDEHTCTHAIGIDFAVVGGFQKVSLLGSLERLYGRSMIKFAVSRVHDYVRKELEGAK